MRHTRYRRLDTLILGANPDKLEARKRLDLRVPVDCGNRSAWKARPAQINGLIEKASQVGGGVEGQRVNGDWERIYRYATKEGLPSGLSQSTGAWFEVRAIREVL